MRGQPVQEAATGGGLQLRLVKGVQACPGSRVQRRATRGPAGVAGQAGDLPKGLQQQRAGYHGAGLRKPAGSLPEWGAQGVPAEGGRHQEKPPPGPAPPGAHPLTDQRPDGRAVSNGSGLTNGRKVKHPSNLLPTQFLSTPSPYIFSYDQE